MIPHRISPFPSGIVLRLHSAGAPIAHRAFSRLNRCDTLITILLVALALIAGGINEADAQAVSFTAPSWPIGSSGTANGSGFPANSTVTLAAMHNGVAVWTGSATANSSGAFSTTVPVTSIGFYILNANGWPAINFAVVPVPTTTSNKPISWVAVNTHFKQHSIPSTAFLNLKNLSIDGVRDELGWATVETTPGVYDFSMYDSYVNGLAGQNLSLMFCASTFNNQAISADASTSDAAKDKYANFVVAALQHYGSKIFAVEVLNEPNKPTWVPDGNYLTLAMKTWTAISGAHLSPSPYVISCGGGGIGEGIGGDFSAQFYAAGGAAYCTGFSQHPYTAYSGDLGYHSGSSAANIGNACSISTSRTTSHGQTKGGWMTEYGWTAPTSIREPQQAGFLVRGLLTVSEYPSIHGVAAYEYQDYNGLWGMTHADLSPKTAYQAFAVAANFLRGKTYVRHIQSDSTYLWADVYKDTNGKYWVAVWGAEDTEANVKAGTPIDPTFVENRVSFNITLAAGATGYNWEGQSITPSTSMVAGTQPMFINTNLTTDTITVSQTAVSNGPIANGNWIMTPACASDSRLDAQGSGTTNGTKVQIWLNNGNPNQKWIFTTVGNGLYEISPSYAPTLCLDVSGHGTTDGTAVQLWTYEGNTNQQWRISSVAGGYRISPSHALNECLNVTGGSNVNGTQIDIDTFVDGDPASIWTLK